jgi:hypothetical protein
MKLQVSLKVKTMSFAEIPSTHEHLSRRKGGWDRGQVMLYGHISLQGPWFFSYICNGVYVHWKLSGCFLVNTINFIYTRKHTVLGRDKDNREEIHFTIEDSTTQGLTDHL